MQLSQNHIDFINGPTVKWTVSGADATKLPKDVLLEFSNNRALHAGTYIVNTGMGIKNAVANTMDHPLKFVIKPADRDRLLSFKDIDFIADALGEPRNMVTHAQPQKRAPVWELVPVSAPLSHRDKSLLTALGSIFEEKDGKLIYDGSPSSRVFIPSPLSKLSVFGFEKELFDIENGPRGINRMTVTEQGVGRMAEVGFLPAMRLLMRQSEPQDMLDKIDKVQTALAGFGGSFTQKSNVLYSIPFDDTDAVRQSHVYHLFEEIGGKPRAVMENGKACMALPANNAGKLAILGIDSLRGMGTHYECLNTAYQSIAIN